MDRVEGKYQTSFSFFESTQLKATKFGISIGLIILIASLLRGFVPLLIGDFIETKNIYYTISGLTLLYSSYLIITIQKSIIPIRLIYLLVLNLLFFVFWILVDYFSNPFYFFSMAIFPFLMANYCLVPSSAFNKVIFLLVPVITGAVIFDYFLINSGLFENGYEIREKLRLLIISDEHAPTHTRNISNNLMRTTYRAVGLTGEEHETASILVMLGAFLLSINNNSLKAQYRFLLIILVYASLILTASGVNVVIGFLSSLFIILYKLKYLSKSFIFIRLSFSVILVLIFFSLFPGFLDVIAIPISRVTNTNSLYYIFSQQVDINLFNELLSVILGHTRSLNIAQFGIISEFAFVRAAFQSGLLLFFVTSTIWFFPLILFLRTDESTKQKMFPYIASIAAGLLTLLHYGTLFRTTNIVLFYAFFGMSIRLYVLSKNYKHHNEEVPTK